jgi:hypothetical protein
MKGKIYKLIDPRDNSIRYIGQTTKDLKTRYRGHMNDSISQNKNYRKCIWIRKLVKLGILPIIELIEEVELQNLDEREEYWIKFYKDMGINLTNTLNSKNEVCGKIKEYQRKLSDKPIYTFNRYTGEKLEFKSSYEASDILKLNRYNIAKCISAKGACKCYFIQYIPFEDNWIPPIIKHFISIQLTDINGSKFKFPSIAKAIEFTKGTVRQHKNGTRSAINTNKFYRGYYWKEIKGPLFLEQCELDKLPENPEEDNQQPIISLND